MNCIYGPFLTIHGKSRIQKIQNSCIRYCYTLHWREDTSPYILQAGWLNMAQRRYFHLSSLIYKTINTNTPCYLGDLIERRKDTHSVNTRRREKLSVPIHKTEKYKACFLNMASLIYNTLSDSFRQDRYNKKATKQSILRNVLEL